MDRSEGTWGPRRGVVWIKLLVGLVAVVGVGGAGYALLSGSTAAGPMPGTAELARASVIDFEMTVTATGDLRAKNQHEIRSELESPSTIAEVIDEGTTVKKGDLLVRLNADELVAEVEEEQLRVESARNELIAAENDYEIQVSENESSVRKAKLALQLAQLALAQYQEGDVEKTSTDLTQKIDSAQRNLDRLEKKHEQNLGLAAKGFISSDELERGRIELEEARARLKIAELDLEIFKEYQHPRDLEQKRSDVAEAEAELDRVERENSIQLASKEAARVNAQRQLGIREQRLEKDQKQLDACTIRAPRAGLVVYGTSTRPSWYFDNEGPLQIGRQVHPNELLLVLPDTSEMVAEVRVPESIAGRVEPGQQARVKVDALGGERFSGVVQSKGVLAEQGGWRDPNSREYAVKIAIDSSSADGRLKPSMRCEAEILLGRVDDALSVPIQAVFRDGPVQFLYVPEGPKFDRVPVKVGRRSDTYAEILGGVEAGTQVLVRDPKPNEIMRDKWSPEELAAVGIEVGEDGQPRQSGRQAGRQWDKGGAEAGAEQAPEAETNAKADDSGDAAAVAPADTDSSTTTETVSTKESGEG